MTLILASGSPRRAELLDRLGLAYSVAPGRVEEGEPCAPYQEWVQELSRIKALAAPAGKGDVVLAADTLVVLGNRVLGKPQDAQEAAEMLAFLSGRVHQVMTGICVVDHSENSGSGHVDVYQDVEVTSVFFRHLTSREIQAYVNSGEPLDKAGAYGIQGLGALLVERIEGCYYNVVGLPLVKTMYLLRNCGIPVLGVSAG
ncbi:MAG: Maf family protein [Peptococcaceae bacterium]|jgi:septum formation protein|nr:Maf family protein [Peptococcaceae bacterium]MDH7524238.1 Maf family protein [Peptococcaceae bacterium]